jgi:hypothetical protein
MLFEGVKKLQNHPKRHVDGTQSKDGGRNVRYFLLSLFISGSCLFWQVDSSARTIYKWHDENGMVHVVDEIRMVPQQYQNQTKSIIIRGEEGSDTVSTGLDKPAEETLSPRGRSNELAHH